MLAALEVGLPCVLKQTTGVDCPLCGATRATFALLRGEVGEALDLNALYVLLLPALLTVAVVWLVRRSRPALPERPSSSEPSVPGGSLRTSGTRPPPTRC